MLHIQYFQKHGEIASEKVQDEDTEETHVYKILKSKDAYIFKEGSIICWGMNTHEEESWVEHIKKLSNINSKVVPFVEDVSIIKTMYFICIIN